MEFLEKNKIPTPERKRLSVKGTALNENQKSRFFLCLETRRIPTEQQVLRNDGCCVIKMLQSKKLLPAESRILEAEGHL